jgi:hypothetical protein
MSNGRYSASVDQLSQHLLRSAARRRDQPSTRSPALRYWNLAQQRHYRRSAPCRRAMPVSGDCAARHDPHTRGKRPGFRPRQANSRERRTVCWREMDSNFQYAGTVNLVVASLCRSIAWDGSARRSGVTAIRVRNLGAPRGGIADRGSRTGRARGNASLIFATGRCPALYGHAPCMVGECSMEVTKCPICHSRERVYGI